MWKIGSRRWAIVLAAGDGSRLGHLTRDSLGRPTPKQFCSIAGGPSLLEEALARGARFVGPDRVVTVVAAKHAEWWRHDTEGLSPANVVVQPLNRGTATGILLPLLEVARRDPGARVIVLPSDHFIENEAVLARAVRQAFDAVEHDPRTVVLLGITPDRPDPELGWIVPARHRRGAVSSVERFVEKPPLEVVSELESHGGVWNSFIFVGHAATLLDLYRRSLPAVLETLAGAVNLDATYGPQARAIEAVYPGIPSRDFSRDLLEKNANALRVLTVGPCGWTDLGTPERLARHTGAFAIAARSAPAGRRSSATALRPRLAEVV